MNFTEQQTALREQLAKTEQQLAQLTIAKCRIEGALAIIDQHLLDEASIPKATEASLGVEAETKSPE